MKWTYSIKNKLTAAAVLLVLCLLVLLSTYNDRRHTQEVKEMISTLYQDRIMAEVYIISFSDHLYNIREQLARKRDGGVAMDDSIQNRISDINAVSAAYLKTKLTPLESTQFTAFRQLIQKLSQPANQTYAAGLPLTEDALKVLKALSNIQVDESKLIVGNSEKQYQASKVSSQFAFSLVIIILLVLQALVFSSTTFHISNKETRASLN
jgi:hypothetical protein